MIARYDKDELGMVKMKGRKGPDCVAKAEVEVRNFQARSSSGCQQEREVQSQTGESLKA